MWWLRKRLSSCRGPDCFCCLTVTVEVVEDEDAILESVEEAGMPERSPGGELFVDCENGEWNPKRLRRRGGRASLVGLEVGCSAGVREAGESGADGDRIGGDAGRDRERLREREGLDCA